MSVRADEGLPSDCIGARGRSRVYDARRLPAFGRLRLRGLVRALRLLVAEAGVQPVGGQMVATHTSEGIMRTLGGIARALVGIGWHRRARACASAEL